MEGLWVLVFSPRSGPNQLLYLSSAGVPARKTCGSFYHLKGLCCGHRRSERAEWDSPAETSDSLCIYARCPASETSAPHWSSFLGLISRHWGSNGKPQLSQLQDGFWLSRLLFCLALTSLKRVGDLQALSVSEMCMDFAPGQGKPYAQASIAPRF